MCLGNCIDTGDESYFHTFTSLDDGTGWESFIANPIWRYPYSVDSAYSLKPGIWEFSQVLTVNAHSGPDPVSITDVFFGSVSPINLMEDVHYRQAGGLHSSWDDSAAPVYTYSHSPNIRVCFCRQFRISHGVFIVGTNNPTPESFQTFTIEITGTRVGDKCDPII